MLLSFKVSNSRSIGEMVEFSMIADPTILDLQERNTIYIEKYGIHVLKVAAIYGANASGKSNFLKSIIDGNNIFQRGLFTEGDSKNNILNQETHLNQNRGKNFKNELTRYIFLFYSNELVYEYKFSANQTRIVDEQILVYPDNLDKFYTFFRRSFDNEKKEYNWFFHKDISEEIKTITKPFTKRADTWLSKIIELSNDDNQYKVEHIENIRMWLSEKLKLSINLQSVGSYGKPFSFLAATQDKDFKQKLLEALKIADFKIEDIIVKVKKEDDSKFNINVKFKHFGIKQLFEPDEESTGTINFIEWIFPFNSVVTQGHTLFVDEFGNSMHPYLCEHLVNWFYETETNAQLIFTTHHTEFLDRKKIRPDQIWLTLRNMQDYTQIRPLSDFEIPEGVAYDRLYLQGIVGGVPHLSVLKPVESHDE